MSMEIDTNMGINTDYENTASLVRQTENLEQAHKAQETTSTTTNRAAGSAYVEDAKVDTATINAMKAEFRLKYQAYQQMIVKLFQNMGKAIDNSLYDLMDEDGYGDLKDRISGLDVDDETKAQANALIADDGDFGIEQTSTRIMDFAKALAGGDPSKLELLREAVERGFDEAASAWGGSLPDICQQTFDKVMEEFSNLEKAGLEENPLEVEA